LTERKRKKLKWGVRTKKFKKREREDRMKVSDTNYDFFQKAGSPLEKDCAFAPKRTDRSRVKGTQHAPKRSCPKDIKEKRDISLTEEKKGITSSCFLRRGETGWLPLVGK